MAATLAPMLAAALLLAAAPAGAQGAAPGAATGAAPTEEFGPWLLGCAGDRMTDRTECRLIHRTPAVPASPGQAAMALEVVRRGELLLPAVTARDLGLDGAGRGVLALFGTAQLRFPPNRLFEMPCALEGRSVVCAPAEADAARAAAELPGAARALVRLSGLLPDAAARTAEPVELPLGRTAEALSRFRTRAPEAAPPEPPAGIGLRDILARLLRLLGE